MGEKHIYEGKTTNEAVEKGLKELNLKKSDVEIIVLKDEEKRSFFSILEPRVVKVELKIKENIQPKEREYRNIEKEKKELSPEASKKAKENIETFLNTFLKQVEDELTFEISEDQYYLYINIYGEKTNQLIGYRGETLNAIQTLLGAVANKDIEEKVRVIVDISGYREKRKRVLEELAEKVAKTVIKTKRKVTLEPMSAYERKVIHSKLQKNSKVITQSVGEEPNRKVVILLKK